MTIWKQCCVIDGPTLIWVHLQIATSISNHKQKGSLERKHNRTSEETNASKETTARQINKDSSDHPTGNGKPRTSSGREWEHGREGT